MSPFSFFIPTLPPPLQFSLLALLTSFQNIFLFPPKFCITRLPHLSSASLFASFTFLFVSLTTLGNNKDISDAFNEYFVNVGQPLANNIDSIDVDRNRFPDERTLVNLTLIETTEDEVAVLLAGMNDAAAGYDDIPPKIVKKVINEIVSPLTYICNLSLINGLFPDKLKTSKITPIFKKGSKKRYRTIDQYQYYLVLVNYLKN